MSISSLIHKAGLRQVHLARQLGVSPGTLADAINHGQWPKGKPGMRDELSAHLVGAGVPAARVAKALEAVPAENHAGAHHAATKDNARVAGGRRTHSQEVSTEKEKTQMLARKQTITPEARAAFALARDPFVEDVGDAGDVFLSADIRRVREAMWATARHGGLMAVVGESGAGKTTLRRDLLDRIQREKSSTIVIEPYVLAMEESDVKGKTLKSAHIAEAIITAINPLERPKRSPEARFRQLHALLKDSYRSGGRHVLVIEEAHCLPTTTLKHLKRFYELEDGFKKLLAIILIGQPELRLRLSERNAEVREVVQRCEIVEIAPLDNHLEAYLRFKLKRIGSDLERIFDKGAIDALREKLTFAPKSTRTAMTEPVSLLYPLAVANIVCAALNLAADIGAPKINVDIIQEV